MEKDVVCYYFEGYFQWDDYSCYDNKGEDVMLYNDLVIACFRFSVEFLLLVGNLVEILLRVFVQ